MKTKILPKELRGAIYARSSDDEEALSLESQVAICREHAQSSAAYKRATLNIAHILVERAGTSGGDANRAKYQELLYLIRSEAINSIFAKEISRLSRNIGDFHTLMLLCSEHNVQIFIPGLDIDLNSPTGKIIVQILAVFAQFEREMVIARTKSAIRAHSLNGKLHGQPVILGFNKGTERGTWIPVEEQIQTVTDIFNTFARYKSYAPTVELLNQLGIKTKKGIDFDYPALKRILTNRKYIGKLQISGEDKEVNLPFGAVVPVELFNDVQSIVASIDGELRGKARNPNMVYLLSGLLFTAQGNSFSGTSATKKDGTQRRYYRCSKEDVTFPCEEMEDAVLRAVEDICKNEGMKQYREEVKNTNEEKVSALKRSILATSKEIERLVSIKSKSVDALMIDPTSVLIKEIESRVLSINSQTEDLTKKHTELIQELNEVEKAEESISTLEKAIKKNDFINKELKDRKAVRGWLRGLFDKIVIDIETKKIKIFWKYQLTGGKHLLPYKAAIPVGSRRQATKSALDLDKGSIEKSKLHELTVIKKLTSSQIAKELNVSRSTVSKYQKLYGIPTLKIGSNKKRTRGVAFGEKILASGKVIRLAEEQKVLSAIQMWRGQGKTFQEIADTLNELGTPTKTGEGKWHRKTIHQLLSRLETP